MSNRISKEARPAKMNDNQIEFLSLKKEWRTSFFATSFSEGDISTKTDNIVNNLHLVIVERNWLFYGENSTHVPEVFEKLVIDLIIAQGLEPNKNLYNSTIKSLCGLWKKQNSGETNPRIDAIEKLSGAGRLSYEPVNYFGDASKRYGLSYANPKSNPFSWETARLTGIQQINEGIAFLQEVKDRLSHSNEPTIEDKTEGSIELRALSFIDKKISQLRDAKDKYKINDRYHGLPASQDLWEPHIKGFPVDRFVELTAESVQEIFWSCDEKPPFKKKDIANMRKRAQIKARTKFANANMQFDNKIKMECTTLKHRRSGYCSSITPSIARTDETNDIPVNCVRDVFKVTGRISEDQKQCEHESHRIKKTKLEYTAMDPSLSNISENDNDMKTEDVHVKLSFSDKSESGDEMKNDNQIDEVKNDSESDENNSFSIYDEDDEVIVPWDDLQLGHEDQNNMEGLTISSIQFGAVYSLKQARSLFEKRKTIREGELVPSKNVVVDVRFLNGKLNEDRMNELHKYYMETVSLENAVEYVPLNLSPVRLLENSRQNRDGFTRLDGIITDHPDHSRLLQTDLEYALCYQTFKEMRNNRRLHTGVNAYFATCIIVYICNKLGIDVFTGCKSAKDRTGEFIYTMQIFLNSLYRLTHDSSIDDSQSIQTRVSHIRARYEFNFCALYPKDNLQVSLDGRIANVTTTIGSAGSPGSKNTSGLEVIQQSIEPFGSSKNYYEGWSRKAQS